MIHHELPLLLLSKLFTIVDEALVVSEAAIDGSGEYHIVVGLVLANFFLLEL